MPRRSYMVSYDIADDKRRTRIFKTLHGYGDRVQYSVFFCELNQQELIKLRTRLTEALNQDEDQVIILDLGEGLVSLERSLQCLGTTYTPPEQTLIV